MALPRWFSRRMQREALRNLRHSRSGGIESVGHLDASIFRYYLHYHVLPRSRACYNEALTRNQTQGGRVFLNFEVGKGEIMWVAAETKALQSDDPKFVSCLENAGWSLRIPAGKLDDQVYRLRYPLNFRPPKGGIAPSIDEGPDPRFERLLDWADTLSR